MLEVGSVVAGKLRIERILGRGGMGTVVVATHLGLDQQVAIKVLHAELADQPEVVARFVREARASAQLRSEHVCRVTDVGELDTGEPYIEMELLDGADLSNVIAAAPLAIETAVDYVLQACVAVAEAHALGIIHRDLKPANLFVTRRLDGSALVKVLDFGIATAPTASEFKITRTTTVMGSPGYMSPEHLRSARDVDVRSDIWALGVILYEAVSGRLPFNAVTITELAVKVVVDAPDPIGAVDPRFAAIAMRCLEKLPEHRYQNVSELAAELATLGGPGAHATAMLIARISGGVTIPPPPVTRARAIGNATTLHTASGEATAPSRRRRGLALLVGAGLIVAGGAVAATLVWTGRDEPQRRVAAIPTVPAVPPGPRDAATLARDAASVANAALDAPDGRLHEKLQQLAAARDWPAILALADLDRDDPVVADAKQHYLAQQMQVLEAYAQRGDCAHGREISAASAKLLPDDTTLAAKAKLCVSRVAAGRPVTDLDRADEALDRHDYPKALELAEKTMAQDPGNSEALRDAALAACGANIVDKARAYIAKLKGADRNLATFVCNKNHVKLFEPPPGETIYDNTDLARDINAAHTAERARNYAAAAAAAERILKSRRGNAEALRILGEAGCRLKDPRRVKAALAQLPPRGPISLVLRRICADEGVPLD